MAFIPFAMADPMEAFQGCFRQVGPNMNMGFPVDMSMMGGVNAQARAGCHRPQQRFPGRQNKHEVSEVHNDSDTYRINVNVKQFTPEEISVRVVDHSIIVEGKHNEKQENENEYVSRHLVRRYVIPEDVRSEAITSSMSSDGILTITAPKVRPTQEEGGRSIPITVTGIPAKQSTSSEPPAAKNDEKSKE